MTVLFFKNPITGFFGAAAAFLLLFNGDILGCTGIASSAFISPRKAMSDQFQYWKLVFFASFLFTSREFFSSFAIDDVLANDETYPRFSGVGYLLGGFLVGMGSELGNGCTSGHGICGMARFFSRRSIIAVMTFMEMPIISALLTPPLASFGVADHTEFLRGEENGFGLTKVELLGTLIPALR